MMLLARRRGHPPALRAAGFTIIELAVVLVIVTLLIGSFLYPLSTQVDQRNIADTQRRLEDIREALITYAIVNGRFPCPAQVSSPPASTDSGQEPAGTVQGTGVCPGGGAGYSGYVPGKVLGINNLDSQGFALDAWGATPASRIRYAVANVNLTGVGGTSTFTSNGATSGMRAAGITGIGNTGTALLYVCVNSTDLPTPNPTDCHTNAPSSLTSQQNAYSNGDAVFVLYSVGKDIASQEGFGNSVFVSQPVSTSTFDDQALWASRLTVISRLLTAGQLP
jgi:type II secretory pathway pseudopilin PulG